VPGDAGGLREANRRLRELLAGRDAQLAAQAAENAELRALVASLRAQVADLAARVKTNSRNSSRPPSADGLSKPAPKSLRKKTGRGPGRPKGQPGATMELTDHPDRVVRHEPSCCAGCGADLDGAPETGAERRPAGERRGHRASADRAAVQRLRHQDERPRAGRGERTGAVRAAGRGAGHLPVARAVPVPGPGSRRAGGDVRGRAVRPGRQPSAADLAATRAVVTRTTAMPVQLHAQPHQVLKYRGVYVAGHDRRHRRVAGEGLGGVAVQPGAPVAAAALGGLGAVRGPLGADRSGK